MTLKTRALCLALLAPVLLASCNDVGDDGDANTNGYGYSIPSSILQLQSGTTTTVPVTIVRYGTFDGAVTFTAEQVPAGLTVSFVPAIIPTGSNSSLMTVVVSPTATTNSYTFTVRSTADKLQPVVNQLPVVVTAVTSAIALTASPAVATIQQGKAGQAVTVNIARTAFAGEVAFGVASNVPTGFTVNFATSPTTGNSVVVTFAATTATPVGTYTVSLQGSGNGIASQTTSVAVTVTAPTAVASPN